MRYFLIIWLLWMGLVSTQAQDEFYGPSHSGIREALWKDDSTQFMTWGYSSFVKVWNDNDGRLLLELDHRQYSVEFISEAYWSDDGQEIITILYTGNADSHVRQQAWSVETGKMLYSYIVASSHPHGGYFSLSQKMEGTDYVASWHDDTIEFININPKSEDVGEVLYTKTFHNQIIQSVERNPDATQALIQTYPPTTNDCRHCIVWFYLVDTDIESATFGEILWTTLASAYAGSHLWYNEQGYMLISFENDESPELVSNQTLQLWDLNVDSPTFGTQIWETTMEMGTLETVIYHEPTARLFVVHLTNIEYIEGAHPLAHPRCIDQQCHFNVLVWNIDGQASDFGTITHQFVHTYKENTQDSRIILNESETQLHITTVDSNETDSGWEYVDNLTAYDLETWDMVEPTGIIPEPDTVYPTTTRIDVDLSKIENTSDYYAIAVNPDKTKAMVKSFSRSADLVFIFDLQTGEWLLPKMAG